MNQLAYAGPSAPPVVQGQTEECCEVPAGVGPMTQFGAVTYPVTYVPPGYQSSAPGYNTDMTGQVMPKPTTLVMPTLESAKQVVIPPSNTGLTPQSLNRQLPSIVSTVPVAVNQAPCDGFAQWVDQNTGLAVLLLAGVAGLVIAHKGNK